MGELQDPPTVDVEKAQKILQSHWGQIFPETGDFINEPWLTMIRCLVNSKTKSYRYAVITQVLGKVVNSSIDCRWLQAKRGFDARSFCGKIIVAFDQQLDGVLGGSSDPYVSKPLRHDELSREYLHEIKNKQEWEILCSLMDEIQSRNDPNFTTKVLDQILLEIYRRLSEIRVTYPEPRQASTIETIGLIEEYTSEPSGGLRPEVVVYSLLKTLAEKSNLFADIDSSKVTAPNRFMERVGDVQCYNANGNIKLAVSVKDIELEKRMVEDDVQKLHEKGVHNLMLMAFKGIKKDEVEGIGELVKRELAIGYNIDIMASPELELKAVISFLGGEGRASFLKGISHALEEMRAPYEHRKKWAELLAGLADRVSRRTSQLGQPKKLVDNMS